MSTILTVVGSFFGPVGAAVGRAVGTAIEGKQASRAAKRASRAQTRGFQQGIDEIRRFTEQGQAGFQPFLTGGTNAFNRQQALLGLLGPEQAQEAIDSFQESPGQQFLRERGQRSLLRNAAAIGGLGGGNVRSALVQQGIGFAQQDFGNFFNRLAGLSNQGLSAAGGSGQLGANAGANIAQLFGSQGQARASGILGAQQARAGTQEQLAGLLSQFSSGGSSPSGGSSLGSQVDDIFNTPDLF